MGVPSGMVCYVANDADADADADAVTPSSNTRNYTRRSVPSSLGRSFLDTIAFPSSYPW